MLIYEPVSFGNLTLKNRMVMAPMCMYSSDTTGQVMDFHHQHYVSRAVGGVGFILMEASAVAPNGRISDQDLGIWSDDHVPGLKSIVNQIHAFGAKVGIQLAHGGRKYTGTDGGHPVAPSAIPLEADGVVPEALSVKAINDVVQAFVKGARRAYEAGFDCVEIHGAHGYLIHEFMSPLSNHRADAYGGTLENRARLLHEILVAIREVVPEDYPILLRISAKDYLPGGLEVSDWIQVIRSLKNIGLDMVHVSSGGLLAAPIQPYPGYQIPMATAIKSACDMPVIGVGLITEITMAESLIQNQQVDLVAFARLLLRNPYFPLQHLPKEKSEDPINGYPTPYRRGF